MSLIAVSCSNMGRNQRLRVNYFKACLPFNLYAKLYNSRMRSNAPKVIGDLIATQEKLYHAGARNFLFIDVPPIHRSPASREFSSLNHDAHS